MTGTAPASWNLVHDVQQMWSLPFMVNAYRAGSIAAVLAALVGYFMILRKQTFAGHTLSVVGFPGAAGAIWLGVSATYGYFAFCLGSAAVIALAPLRGRRFAEESALIGTVQAFALACGFLFVALYNGFLGGTTALLFGSFLGITTGQVDVLAVVAPLVVAALAVMARPLLFVSLDPDVARAHRVPVRFVDVGFLLLLAASVAETAQITGVLLVFTLLVLPPATAQRLTTRPARGLLLSVALALVTTWVALGIAFYSPYPIGFWLSTIAFVEYVVAVAATSLAAARSRRGIGLHVAAGSA
ncbi:MAG TPA: metal ABC transporter permease [Mycobacteriales bacterium]|nr:metal ABC transporter permease [Mycobacteriales bacterium]